MTVNFITSNPALDTYQKLQKEERESRLSDAHAALLGNQVEDLSRSRDSRLRSIDAKALADETEAGVGASTAPIRVQQAGVGLEQAQTNLGSSKVEAGVHAATAPVRIEQAGVGLRQAKAGALNTELQSRYKVLDLLDSGNVEGAQEVARAVGYELTPEMINNADWRHYVKEVHKNALVIHPNRPQDQQIYIDAKVGEARNLGMAGRPPSDPTSIYTTPPGAPQPQVTSGGTFQRFNTTGQDENGNTVPGVQVYNSKDEGPGTFQPHAPIQKPTGAGGAGAGGKTSVFQQKQAAWLAVHEGDAQGALDFANGRRQMSVPEMVKSAQSQAAREINGNMMLKFGKEADRAAAVNKRAQEIYGQLQGGFGAPAAPAAPAAPVAPAPQRPDMMTPGNGTRPLDIQAPPPPPGVPPGSSYSPSRQMWRSADGQVFDANGQPVQQ